MVIHGYTYCEVNDQYSKALSQGGGGYQNCCKVDRCNYKDYIT